MDEFDELLECVKIMEAGPTPSSVIKSTTGNEKSKGSELEISTGKLTKGEIRVL